MENREGKGGSAKNGRGGKMEGPRTSCRTSPTCCTTGSRDSLVYSSSLPDSESTRRG